MCIFRFYLGLVEILSGAQVPLRPFWKQSLLLSLESDEEPFGGFLFKCQDIVEILRPGGCSTSFNPSTGVGGGQGQVDPCELKPA